MATLTKLQAQPMMEVVSMSRGWLATSGGLGAIIGLRAMVTQFGRPGLWGTLSSGFAGLIAALVLGVVGGTLVLPAYGTMFGPWLVLAGFLKAPIIMVPWAFVVFGVHKAQQSYTRERETINNFKPRRVDTGSSRDLT